MNKDSLPDYSANVPAANLGCTQPAKVLLFAAAAEKVGEPKIVVEVPIQATIAQVAEAVRQVMPEISDLLEVSRWALNQRFVPLETQINADDEIALIPPVSGG